VLGELGSEFKLSPPKLSTLEAIFLEALEKKALEEFVLATMET
jgi:hypothetical protein